MEFNKITRGAKRAVYDEKTVNEIIDAGFLCHISFVHNGVAMCIPTAYGRKNEVLYFHGSTKNFTLNAIVEQKNCTVSITHLDGIVLAKNLFHSSANYRSVVLMGSCEIVHDEHERLEALEIITENISEGRWAEVPVGDTNELKATLVVKFTIERASAKVRNVGPEGDEAVINSAWTGVIPLKLIADTPIPDKKWVQPKDLPTSVINVRKKFQ